jgi:hypothetical protein
VLVSYSAPLRSYVDWRGTENGNVDVLNEAADYYRYFDATAHAEFLYETVAQTVEHDLPDEVRFLEAFDRFAARCQGDRGDRAHRGPVRPLVRGVG